MYNLRNAALSALAGLVGLFMAGAALASVPPTGQCITVSNASLGNVLYDPFNPNGVPTTNLTLTINRWNGPGGAKTQTAGLIFLNNSATFTGISILNANSENILYQAPGPANVPVDQQAPGQLYVQFNGVGLPDVQTVQVPVTVTLPAGLNVAAGSSTNLTFDVKYDCHVTGNGHDPNEFQETSTSGLTLTITVLSALQAHYAGTALDFGAIGLIPPNGTATAGGSNNYINVASSGPYTVDVAAPFRMTYPGGDRSNAAQRVRYSVRFLGETVNDSTPFTTRHCLRGGLPNGEHLPIGATLLEGGQGKPPGNYSDTVAVTIAPQVNLFGDETQCSNYTVP
jgi:spore coat protein U-like protein